LLGALTTAMDLSPVERISKTITELFKEFYAQFTKLQPLPAQFEKMQTQMDKMQTQTDKMQTQMEKLQLPH
jgi:hypothetical protein